MTSRLCEIAGALGIVCVILCAVVAVGFAAWKELRSRVSLPPVQIALVGALVVGLVHYGATKSVVFTDGIKAAAASWATNDLIHVSWQRDTSHGVYVPTNAAVYIDYRPSGSTNDWGLLGQAVVGDWQWEGSVGAGLFASNFDYHVWAYYIPPEPVHTNGVWIYRTMKDRAGKFPIPLRARIEVNGKAIATPAEKRKDEER